MAPKWTILTLGNHQDTPHYSLVPAEIDFCVYFPGAKLASKLG